MVEAIIFDLDGTLLDSMPMWQNFGRLYLKELGIEAKDKIDRDLFAMTPAQSAQYFIDHYQVDKTVPEMVDEMAEIAHRFYENQVKEKPGAKDFLEFLKSKEIPLAVATVTNKDSTYAGLKQNNMLDYFSSIVTVADVGIGKEDPAVFLEAARKLQAKPEKSVIVEDALHAVKTAKSAKFITAGIFDQVNHYFQKDLMNTCDLYLENYQNPANIFEQLNQLI